jgi:hypothetical protein
MPYWHTSKKDLARLWVAEENVEMFAQLVISFLLSWPDVNDVKRGVSLNKSLKECGELVGSTDSLGSG